MGETHIVKFTATIMRTSIILSIFCLIGVLNAAPTIDDENDDERIVIPRSFFDKSLVKYTAKHDIVEILVPLNALNFDDSDDAEDKNNSNENFSKDMVIFFVEADIRNGQRIDRGLYVYKNGYAKNILPTGRTAAATSNDRKNVYFGASDGLYAYDADSDTAVKHGPITDGIISMVVDEALHTIFILTDDHKLYNVSNDGEAKILVGEVEDAQEIVIDDCHNIYYYNSNKEVFIRTADGVIKVQDLPNANFLKLVRPPFIMEDGVPLMADNALYFVYANGTSESTIIEFSPDARPTAFGPEVVLIQYYAFNKRIYEYNFTQIMSLALFEDIKDKAKTIHSTATKTKNVLGSKRE